MKLDILTRLLPVIPERRVIVGVSGGKDSLAVLELMHLHGFTVLPYHLYVVPEISFVESNLARLERRYGFTIPRFPHPSLSDFIRYGRYCEPVPDYPRLTFKDVQDGVRAHYGDSRLWITNGEKKQDSVQRRGMMSACGSINEKRRVAFPLADWSDGEVRAFLRHRRVTLPVDYSSGIGGSWSGALKPDWLRWIYDHSPEDFQRIERVFPYVRAALLKETRIKARRV